MGRFLFKNYNQFIISLQVIALFLQYKIVRVSSICNQKLKINLKKQNPMKAIKSLFALALIALSLFASGQAITVTQTNPANQLVNNWPGGNSWNMVQPIYNDFVSLNNIATTTTGNNTFIGANTFTGTTTFTGVITGNKSNIISDSVITKVTLTAAQSGSTVLLKALAGDTVALPAATTANLGVKFVILNTYSSTSVGHCIVTNGNDVFWGTAFVSSTTTPFTNPYLSTSNKTMLMTPTTTGGLAGGRIELTCIAGGRWAVTALLYATGTIATPFK